MCRRRLNGLGLAFALILALACAPTASAVTVAAAGDIACPTTSPFYFGGLGDATHCAQKRTSDLLAPTDAVFALGDNQYEAGALDQFRAVYDPTWGRFKSVTFPVIGNHEYGRANASGYFDYFGTRAGPRRPQGWYAFNLGNWHILALNSECHRLPAGTCDVGGAQETFVRNDLRNNPKHCTLAFWHEPRFASGSVASTNEAAMAPIWNDLIDIGHVDVVVSGHKHFYERLAPLGKTGAVDLTRGIRTFIVGTGGDDHSGNPAPRVGSEVRNAKTFGVVKLALNTGGYTWRFVGEPGSTFTDSGSGTCH